MGLLVSKFNTSKGAGRDFTSVPSSKDPKNGSDKVSLNLVKRDKSEILSDKNPAYSYLSL